MHRHRTVLAFDGKTARPPGPLAATVRGTSDRQLGALLRRLRHNRGATIGGVLLLALALGAVLSVAVAPYPPTKPNPAAALQAPSARHWMGTDEIGRDVLSRVLIGARISLRTGLFASALSMVLGTFVGLVAGYSGGWVDAVTMRVVDVMLAVPMPLFALAVVASLGPSTINVMLAVGVAGTPRFTRVIRGSVLSAKQNLYVEAARVIGCRGARIAGRHILPNVMVLAFVLATLNIGNTILIAATLSFLGLGTQPPTPEWGLILSQGRQFLRYAWWISVFPGLAIVITVLSVNMVGDGLRDALDPRLRRGA